MKRAFSMPGTKWGRTVLGVLLILGGLVGFLPVLGFWMIPVGLIVLSRDFAGVRRFRRVWTVRLLRRWRNWRGRGFGRGKQRSRTATAREQVSTRSRV